MKQDDPRRGLDRSTSAGQNRLPREPATPGGQAAFDGARYFRRREQKYEVGPAAATLLREEIARRLPLFEFEPGEPHTYITTLYFDTKDREFYRRAERSYDDNVKIRVKEYFYPSTDRLGEAAATNGVAMGDAGASYRISPYCYVEIKQSIAGVVVKKRFGCPKAELLALLAGRDVWPALKRLTPPAELSSLEAIYRELERYLAAYSVGLTSVVNYRRTVYQQSEESLRITFDDELAVFAPPHCLYESTSALTPEVLGKPIRTSDRVILEIKCPAGYPDWLEKAMQHYSARRLSKFTTSVRLLLGTGNGDSTKGNGEAKAALASPPARTPPHTPVSKDADTELMTGFLS